MTRPSFDDVAMQVAQVIAQRSTCPRLHVGAVICTAEHRIVATGYNGSLPGQAHCEEMTCTACDGSGYHPMFKCKACNGTGKVEAGCILVDNHCVRTVHAEANAITQAAMYGTPLGGCTLYTLASPCLTCAKLIVASGITDIVFAQQYKLEPVINELLHNASIRPRVHVITDQ